MHGVEKLPRDPGTSCSLDSDRILVNTTDLHSYSNESTEIPAPKVAEGRLFASDQPGLGVEPDFDSWRPGGHILRVICRKTHASGVDY